jgi:type IX secretion system PorP/SprF family membrane protein
MKILKSLIFLLACVNSVFAQQHPMVSQYLFNHTFLNPAYAGSQRAFSSSVHHRRQWWGIDGAPVTSILALDGMLKGGNNALGMIITHDKIGVTTESELLLNYAYHLTLTRGHRLSFGLRAGMGHYSANFSNLTLWDPNDPVYNFNITGRLLPKAGFGAFYYSEKAFVGASIPTLMAYDPANNFALDLQRSTFLRRHYFFTAGFWQKINDDVAIRPTVLFKYLPGTPLQADINMNFLFMDAIITGISFRTGESVAAIIEYQTDIGIRIGYAYDYTFNKLRTFTHGSHELVLGWDLIRTDKNEKRLRRF